MELTTCLQELLAVKDVTRHVLYFGNDILGSSLQQEDLIIMGRVVFGVSAIFADQFFVTDTVGHKGFGMIFTGLIQGLLGICSVLSCQVRHEFLFVASVSHMGPVFALHHVVTII